MARVQYGSIVTEIKGKVQGQVFQGGNVGYVLRNKGYTPGFTSNSRQTALNSMTSQTTRWRNLSDANRAAWAAITASWPFINKFGASYSGSGFQVFTSYNSNLLSIGLPAVNTPSAIFTPTNPGVVDLVCESDSTDVSLLVDWENAGGANDYLVILASPAFSPGRNGNFIPLKKVFGGSINALTDVDAGATYKTLFGIPAVGAKVKIVAYFRDGRWPINAFVQSAPTIVVPV